jgi:serine-type D-Ala-D-Ala carboxypeptidase/endopeptidase (penicillin-binding protein 4)
MRHTSLARAPAPSMSRPTIRLHPFEPHATLLRRRGGTSFKSGTFSGVRTMAGYAGSSKHGRVRFVIALTSNGGAMRFRLKVVGSGL